MSEFGWVASVIFLRIDVYKRQAYNRCGTRHRQSASRRFAGRFHFLSVVLPCASFPFSEMSLRRRRSVFRSETSRLRPLCCSHMAISPPMSKINMQAYSHTKMCIRDRNKAVHFNLLQVTKKPPFAKLGIYLFCVFYTIKENFCQ